MVRKFIALVSLLAGMLAACTVTAHGHPAPIRLAIPAATTEVRILRSLNTPCTTVQASIAIPDNVLTGHGAIATPDGVGHF